MEPGGCNRWQSVANRRSARTAKQAKTIGVCCDRLPHAAHGKEGVSGSSPEEGFALRAGFRRIWDSFGSLSHPRGEDSRFERTFFVSRRKGERPTELSTVVRLARETAEINAGDDLEGPYSYGWYDHPFETQREASKRWVIVDRARTTYDAEIKLVSERDWTHRSPRTRRPMMLCPSRA
jgi:hypothetical protein